MDWDLWGPPTDFISEENDVYALYGQKLQFCSCHGYDIIEEEALNDMSRVQVLRILVSKVEYEIDKLEQDLVSLQSDLAWIENKSWPGFCCNALKEKMKFLEVSMGTLKNKNKNDGEVRLLLNAQPVESLHEILKGLLQNFKDNQPACADINEVENTHCFATRIDKRMIQNSSSQDADEEKDAAEMVKSQVAAINAVSSTEKTSRSAIGYTKRNKKLSISVVSKNVEKHSSMSTANVLIIEDSLSKPAGKKINLGKRTKSVNAFIEDFGSSISLQSTIQSMKIISKDDVEVIETKDNGEHHSGDTKSGILISSSNPQGKGKYDKTYKSADGIVTNVVETLRCTTDFYGWEEKTDSSLSTFDQTKSSNVDLDLKICDLAPVCKWMNKGSRSVATANIFSLSSDPKTIGAKKPSPTSFTGPQERKRMNAAKLQAKKKRKYTTEESNFIVPATDKNCCNWIVPYDPKIAKQNANPPIFLEVDLSTTEMHSSSISKGKKRLKPAVSTVNASSNSPCSNLVLPGEIEAEKHGAASDISGWEKLKLRDLQVIAKGFKVKQYYKLPKKRLLEEISRLHGD